MDLPPTIMAHIVFASLTDFYNSVNNGTANATRYERYSARKNGEFPYADVSTLQLGFFAQDKFNVNNNLVLTYGIRADIPVFKQILSPIPTPTLTFKRRCQNKYR